MANIPDRENSIKLRLAFAMGGGVSLGSFSGAALGEAIKLFLLARNTNGSLRFDPVEIDVFSGASAGAMALAAMLRALADAPLQNAPKVAQARTRLEQQHPGALSALQTLKDQDQAKRREEDLLAAQMLQDNQIQIWNEEINIRRLLAIDDHSVQQGRTLEFEPGIVDRKAVEAIARDYICPDHEPDLGKKRLLANRVLYACTLANLTAVVADARREFSGSETGFVGLADGMQSKVHRELRVFDLVFQGADDGGAERWCRYVAKGVTNPATNVLGAMEKRSTWAQMAATAIACGAFPFAFEPVVLTRRAKEYGRLWPESPSDKQEHHFTYVDGGTFNNEPIREAFRLASFIDSSTPDAHFERVVAFVDPFVDDEAPSFRVPVHQAWFQEKPDTFFDGVDMVRRTSLDRLLPHLGTLAGSIIDEGRMIEADKIFQTRERFVLRDNLRFALNLLLNANPKREDFVEVLDFCETTLGKDKTEMMIPPGPLAVPEELARIIWEERDGKLKDLDGEDTLTPARALVAFVKTPGQPEPTHLHLWLRALSFLGIDLVLDMEGKWQDSHLVAIAPFSDLQEDEKKRVTKNSVELPGGAISGFAGFMSRTAGEISVEAGRYCAQEFLFKCGLIGEQPRMPRPEITHNQRDLIQGHVKTGVEQLAKRVQQIVRKSHLIQIFPVLDAALKSAIAAYAENTTNKAAVSTMKAPSTEFEFRIFCFDNKTLEFDRTGAFKDAGPVKDERDGRPVLISFATWDGARWSGTDVAEEGGRQVMTVDHASFASAFDRQFASIELPTPVQIASARLFPYPVFTTQLSEHDSGKSFPSTHWTAGTTARSLEDTLLG